MPTNITTGCFYDINRKIYKARRAEMYKLMQRIGGNALSFESSLPHINGFKQIEKDE